MREIYEWFRRMDKSKHTNIRQFHHVACYLLFITYQNIPHCVPPYAERGVTMHHHASVSVPSDATWPWAWFLWLHPLVVRSYWYWHYCCWVTVFGYPRQPTMSGGERKDGLELAVPWLILVATAWRIEQIGMVERCMRVPQMPMSVAIADAENYSNEH